MSTITDLTDFRLRQLGPEPWGNLLARAREGAGYTLRDVADLLAGHDGLSRGTINRLEQLDEAPTDSVARRRAFQLLIVYGYNPSQLGLGPDDAPTVVDLRALRDLGIDASGWFIGSDDGDVSRPALLAA